VPSVALAEVGDYVFHPSAQNHEDARLARRTLYGGRKARSARRRLYGRGYNEAQIRLLRGDSDKSREEP
jgi:hypothetical protein